MPASRIHPSSFSPDSSNTLVQSSSTSSTLHEHTPPRPSRSRSRYGDLARVPLHRRGTSKTYERLEDLLREAGYKETRVFTPEGERERADDNPQDKPDDRKSSVREGVGAVVGFLAGLVGSRPPSTLNLKSANNPLSHSAAGDDPDNLTVTARYSPPPSPLEYRSHHHKNGKSPTAHSDTSYMTDSIDSLDDPTPRPSRRVRPDMSTANSSRTSLHTMVQPGPRYDHYHQHEHIHHPNPRPAYRSPHPPPSYASERYLRKQLSNASFQHQQPTPLAQPRPSRAGVYLRHMSSIPQIPRPSSTPAQRPSRKAILLNDSDTEDHAHDEDERPPLPRTWLETVARAVLFGASGSYVGGPSAVSPQRQEAHDDNNRGRSQTLRPTRSSLSQASRRKRSNTRRTQRSGFTDQTNTFLAPPPLFMQLERGRSSTSVVQVSHTRVVCRSAPGSRATSAVRSEKGRGRDVSGARRRRRDERERERDRVPSLARTRTEGDMWGKKPRLEGPRRDTRHASGWGMDENEDANEDDDDDDVQCDASSSDDDAGVDLARILVPPKRQNSINSLRKHLNEQSGLHRSASARSVWTRETAGHAIRPLAEEDEWGPSAADAPRNFEDDDESVFDSRKWRGSGRSGTGKRRMGLPNHWGTGRS